VSKARAQGVLFAVAALPRNLEFELCRAIFAARKFDCSLASRQCDPVGVFPGYSATALSICPTTRASCCTRSADAKTQQSCLMIEYHRRQPIYPHTRNPHCHAQGPGTDRQFRILPRARELAIAVTKITRSSVSINCTIASRIKQARWHLAQDQNCRLITARASGDTRNNSRT